MHVREIRFDQKAFAAIPDAERGLLISFAHAINEINILNKTFYLASRFDDEETWLVQVHSSQALLFGKILTGKLYECWELINKAYFAQGIEESLRKRVERVAAAELTFLKQYFTKKNLIKDVRNNFSFHYSIDHAKQIDVAELDKDSLAAYMTDQQGNTMLYFGEAAMNLSLTKTINDRDLAAAVDELIVDTSRIVSKFNRFADALVTEIAEFYLGSDGGTEWLDHTVEAKKLEELTLPFFIEFDSGV